jgi:hypothetical protein
MKEMLSGVFSSHVKYRGASTVGGDESPHFYSKHTHKTYIIKNSLVKSSKKEKNHKFIRDNITRINFFSRKAHGGEKAKQKEMKNRT